MTKLKDLTVAQIQSIIDLKEQIATLQSQIDSIAEGGEAASPASVEAPAAPAAPAKRKYHMSAARKRQLVKTLAKARAARWAKYNSNGATKAEKPPVQEKKRRKMSPEAKAKIAAAAKARWAKVRAEGKTTL